MAMKRLPLPELITAVVFVFGVADCVGPTVWGKQGGSALLKCSLAPAEGSSAPLHVVEWVRQGYDIPVLIKFGSYAPRVHPNYEASFITSTPHHRVSSRLYVLVRVWRDLLSFLPSHCIIPYCLLWGSSTKAVYWERSRSIGWDYLILSSCPEKGPDNGSNVEGVEWLPW
ncbi:hypothetical protein SRHO_G00219260 [Serrasalmus rhombeus]